MSRADKAIRKILANTCSEREAMESSGYAKNYAKNPQDFKATKQFKMKAKPILERYKAELESILSAMELKDKNSEEYATLVRAAETIQKQINLLEGKPTEIVDEISYLTEDELAQRIKEIEIRLREGTGEENGKEGSDLVNGESIRVPEDGSSTLTGSDIPPAPPSNPPEWLATFTEDSLKDDGSNDSVDDPKNTE